MDLPSLIIRIILSVIPALLCITLHECSHGYVAYRLGDQTAKQSGRLTLNPIKHLDLIGLLMMVVFHVGWAKPVPVNMFNFKNPKRGMALTALAGPAANFLTAIVFLFIYGLLIIPLLVLSDTDIGYYFMQIIQLTAYLSIGLGIFNLIPIPPMDGSKILFSLLNDRQYYTLMRYERYGMIVSVILVSSGILGKPLDTAIAFVYEKLAFFAQLGFDIVAFFVKGAFA